MGHIPEQNSDENQIYCNANKGEFKGLTICASLPMLSAVLSDTLEIIQKYILCSLLFYTEFD